MPRSATTRESGGSPQCSHVNQCQVTYHGVVSERAEAPGHHAAQEGLQGGQATLRVAGDPRLVLIEEHEPQALVAALLRAHTHTKALSHIPRLLIVTKKPPWPMKPLHSSRGSHHIPEAQCPLVPLVMSVPREFRQLHRFVPA